MDRFGLSLWFCHPNLIKKPFLMVVGVKEPGISGFYKILSDFRELIFCGPCRPRYFDILTAYQVDRRRKLNKMCLS